MGYQNYNPKTPNQTTNQIMATTKQSKIKKQVLTIKRMIDDWQQYLAYLDANAKK